MLVLVLVLVLAPGGARAAPDPTLDVVRRVARLHGVSVRRPIPTERVSVDAWPARLAAALGARPSRDRLALWARLGLVPEGLDLAALVRRLSQAAMVRYDPRTRHVLVRADAPDDVVARLLPAEVTRALLDQQLELGKWLDAPALSSDERLARRALVDGDALATALELGRLDDTVVAPAEALGREGAHVAPALEGAPRWLRAGAAFSQGAGAAYVRGLVRTKPWATVLQRMRPPPASTAEILHPDRATAPRRPQPGPVTQLADAGLEPRGEDTLGELGVRVFLEELGVPEPDATASAAGWSGDRVLGFAAKGRLPAVLWWTAWASEADANEAETALHQALDGAGERLCDEDTGEGFAIARKGDRVVVALGVPKDEAGAIAAAALEWPEAARKRGEPKKRRR